MRHVQQNKRSRSRGRRQPNPSGQVFESSGPDVKIRGTASHISQKYLNLGRDAQSCGDSVAAENFFQHAEHYSRIVAAAQFSCTQRKSLYPPRVETAPQYQYANDDETADHAEPDNAAVSVGNGEVNTVGDSDWNQPLEIATPGDNTAVVQKQPAEGKDESHQQMVLTDEGRADAKPVRTIRRRIMRTRTTRRRPAAPIATRNRAKGKAENSAPKKSLDTDSEIGTLPRDNNREETVPLSG